MKDYKTISCFKILREGLLEDKEMKKKCFVSKWQTLSAKIVFVSLLYVKYQDDWDKILSGSPQKLILLILMSIMASAHLCLC